MTGRARAPHAGASAAVQELAHVLPRVLIVSRRTVRKSKFVDFVGEYHLDLVVRYGAVPVIVPRVKGLHSLLDSFEPIHGVLLCEGEDIDPSLYESDLSTLSPQEMEEVRLAHSSDVTIDREKDSIELQLAKRCLERNIPYLGICRGSQVLNVACGGSLYTDVERELQRGDVAKVQHINYGDYDGHRHPITVTARTPLAEWFHESLKERGHGEELIGVRRLAGRFQAMAHAPDGLVEAFYDPGYNPAEGRYIVGLQFHPERMRHEQDAHITSMPEALESVFDYPECPRAYQEFARAVLAYQKRLLVEANMPRSPVKSPVVLQQDRPLKDLVKEGAMMVLNKEMEEQRQHIVRSFAIAKDLYNEQVQLRKNKTVHDSSAALYALKMARSSSQKDLNLGAEFLEVSTALTTMQVKRLHQMGATVRNSTLFKQQIEEETAQRRAARAHLELLKKQELQEVAAFHKSMYELASDVLQKRHESTVVKALSITE
eukprot:SM000222S06964  [mRNA]  locus=s222:61252:63981:- [translate_table: standard]